MNDRTEWCETSRVNIRELCIANDEGVIEDGFHDLLVAQDRCKEIGDGAVEYRDLYDDDGMWIEDSSE